MRIISNAPLKPLERVMIFIDGGYIRKIFNDLFHSDKLDYWKIRNDLTNFYDNIPSNPFRANLIRAYYYDGIADQCESEYATQRKYFDDLRASCIFFEVKLGEAVKEPNGRFRQKGVDILMAIDSLSMAYMDIYDTGLFLLGDRDFIPLIEAIKNTGKKAFGFLYEKNISDRLRWTFDYRKILSSTEIATWQKIVKNNLF